MNEKVYTPRHAPTTAAPVRPLFQSRPFAPAAAVHPHAPGPILQPQSPLRPSRDQAASTAESPYHREQNTTGLPDTLKAGIEKLAGLSMADVKVHYHSSKPAMMRALAYTQGTEIHVGPGQEKHLAHEAWHVVQQKQRRVQPTLQTKGGAMNDDQGLEREAEVMGARAEHARPGQDMVSHALTPKVPPESVERFQTTEGSKNASPQLQKLQSPQSTVIQRRVGFEFQTDVRLSEYWKSMSIPYNFSVFSAQSGDWKVVNDNKDMEFVTEPFEETKEGKSKLKDTVNEMLIFLKDIVNATKNNKFPEIAKSVKNVKGTTYADGIWDIYVDAPSPLDFKTVKSRPQASGGVTLDNIPMLIENAVMTKLEALKKSPVFQQHNVYVDMAEKLDEKHIKNYEETTYQKISDLPYSVIPTVAEALLPSYAVTLAEHAIQQYTSSQYQDKDIPNHNFRKLKGLLTLIITYLLNTDRGKLVDYSKAAFPLMSRTNFKTMYDALAPEEKAWFTTENVLKAAGMKDKGDEHVFKSGFGQGTDIQFGPTRKQWLSSIKSGTNVSERRTAVDLLSKGSQSSVVAGHAGSSSSLGAFDELDTSLRKEKELAVLEIRTLPNPIGTEDWWPVAETIFSMMKDINNPEALPDLPGLSNFSLFKDKEFLSLEPIENKTNKKEEDDII